MRELNLVGDHPGPGRTSGLQTTCQVTMRKKIDVVGNEYFLNLSVYSSIILVNLVLYITYHIGCSLSLRKLV